MSDDGTGILNDHIHVSDDDSNAASLGSTRLSDDSGIEDWSDDMTIQTEQQDCMVRKDIDGKRSPSELLNNSISPIKDESILTECIFPSLPDLHPVHDFKQDVLSEDAIVGVCGLYNLGNTCFMNAALQCLLVTSALKDLVCKGDILQHGSDHMDEPANVLIFVERFQEMFRKVLTGKYSILRPDQFHMSIARLHPNLGDYKQHDSQEFLSFLLNTLHELLNRGRSKLKNSPQHMIHGSEPMQYGNTSDDFSEKITGDVSKRLKMDNDVEDNGLMEPDAGVECEENLSKAAAAWRTYTSNNQSVIVDSFQGQFQSVIICEKCSFISTTYEPFMSLSLPIPHAMEQQILITWVPSLKLCALPGMISAVKYCITVNKKSSIGDVKEAFLSMLRKKDNQLHANHVVLVEANKSASICILDDRTQISYLSKTKDVYAIEVVHGVNKLSLTDNTYDNGFLNATDYFEEGKSENGIPENIIDTLCNIDIPDSGMATPDSNVGEHTAQDNVTYNNNNGYESTDNTTSTDRNGNSVASGVEDAASWHSCGICLEEIFDEELKVHLICGGLLCDSCLTNLVEVNNTVRFPCPICNRHISTEDYTPLIEPKENGEVEKTIRQVLVPVMFRHDSLNSIKCARKFKLFGHPVICLLSSEVDSSVVLETVNQVLQNLSYTALKFDVVVTDGAGLSCGICDIFSSCTGCHVKDYETLKLKPGCCISVHFHDNIDMVVKTLELFHEDTSMKEFRNTDTVALEECLSKFGDTEVLTKDNPWFCTQCQTNQIAVKNMMVTRWPETLIVHLKRFYFEGNQCCKITCPVDFPMSNLNIDMLTCADGNSDGSKDPILYDLYSFICHTGTLLGGHYTALTKANKQSDWYYFNDESVEKMLPNDDEKEKAYVLFYQKKVLL